MRNFKNLQTAQRAFMRAEKGLKMTPEGNGRYDFEKKPRTPAQQAATQKAGQASAQKRKGGLLS